MNRCAKCGSRISGKGATGLCMSCIKKGVAHSPAHLAALKAARNRPEVREKIRLAVSHPKSETGRINMKSAANRPEVKEANRARAIGENCFSVK